MKLVKYEGTYFRGTGYGTKREGDKVNITGGYTIRRHKVGLPSLKLNRIDKRGKKTGSYKNVTGEALERVGRDPDIDHSKSHLNIIRGFQTSDELQEYTEAHLKEIGEKTGRAVRKDAVVMCATIIKPPAAEILTLPYEEQVRYLNTAIDAFSDIVRRENVKTVVLHFDEMGPHAHIFWEPMTSDGRLCAKEMHNRTFFNQVNQNIPKALREAGFDVADCEMYDLAEKEYADVKKKESGLTSSQFKRKAEQEREIIEKQITERKTELASIKGEILDTKQVVEVKEKRKLFGGDVYEIQGDDLRNLRSTAVEVNKLRKERDDAVKEKEEAIAEKEDAKNEAKREKAEAQKEKESARVAKELADRIITYRDGIIQQAKADAGDIVAKAEGKMNSLEIRIVDLKEQETELEARVEPLAQEIKVAEHTLNEVLSQKDNSRKKAYQDGYEAGVNEGRQEYSELITQERTAVNDAKRQADEIVSNAVKRADDILTDAKEKANGDTEAQRFYDVLMGVEGVGDFKKYRKQAGFWLDVEKLCMESLSVKQELAEMKAIASFIPKQIWDWAKDRFKRLGRPRMSDSEYIVITDSKKHEKMR